MTDVGGYQFWRRLSACVFETEGQRPENNRNNATRLRFFTVASIFLVSIARCCYVLSLSGSKVIFTSKRYRSGLGYQSISDGGRRIHSFPLLEIHVANACNLTCESCSHFSNSGHKGLLEVEEADRWMKAWNSRLQPGMFRLLGGEPTLNPCLSELVDLAAGRWPRSRIGLTTNGFFAHRHPNLGKALGKARAKVHFTAHDRTDEYRAKALPGLELLQKWSGEFGFELQVGMSYENWTRRYIGRGTGVLPFEDRNPRRSWKQCPAKGCRQLFRGRIWKCSPIAYLQLQKETHPGISEKWDPFLAYQPLNPGCSDQELADFFTAEEQSICNMCAAKPKPFRKPSPLIPLSVIRRQDLERSVNEN